MNDSISNRCSLCGEEYSADRVTERKRKEQHLLQLTMAVEQSPSSVIIVDPDGMIEYINAQFTSLTGFTHKEAVGKNVNLVQSGQTPGFIYEEMWQTITAGETWRGEILNKKKNGELYWDSIVIAPLKDGAGNIVNFIATQEDVTARKHDEEALRASEGHYRLLAEYISDVIFTMDMKLKYTYISPSIERLVGFTPDEVMRQSVQESLTPESAELAVRTAREDLENEFKGLNQPDNWRAGIYQRICKDGSIKWIETRSRYLRDKDGKPIGIVGVTRDFDEHKKVEAELRAMNLQLEDQVRKISALEAELRHQAIRDPLTGLYNRRYLVENLEREFQRAMRKSQPLSIVLMDIDHFKALNDTYGHLAGDACLRTLADLLHHHIRKSDMASRYGGEEFLVALPETNLDTAVQRAEQFRLLLAKTPVRHKRRKINLSASFGISSYPLHPCASIDEIVNKADLALYESKRLGRNRVTVWNDKLSHQ